MTLLTAAVLDSMRSTGLPDRWPAVVAEHTALQAQLEAVITAQVDEVRHALIERLGAGDVHGPSWARAALWGLGLAAMEGARAEAVVAPGLLHLRTAGGSPFLLAPLAFLASRGGGTAADVQRLVDTIDGALGGRGFTLHLRKPLPAGVDCSPIAQAIQLWLMALRDGSEVGRCASYEDGDVSLEICLTEVGRGRGESGLVLLIEPKRSLEKLAQVDARLMHAVGEARQAAPGLPVIALCAADRPWRLPRGYVNQVLYGTPREVFASSDAAGYRYEAIYRANGLSLFSDPACKALQSVWWAEPGARDPLGVRAWSSDNPWVECEGQAPILRGKRFWRREGPRGACNTVVMVEGRSPAVEWDPNEGGRA